MTTLNAVLTSPDFNCNDLQISRVRGREAISQPFEFTVDVVCTEPDDFNFEILGARATLEFTLDGASLRETHGIIASATQVFATTRGNQASAFRLVLVPDVWKLNLTDLQQVYLNTSIPNIVKSKFTMNGLTNYEMRLSATYLPRPMVIQLHETDRAFINRLTEHNGISYYFLNANGVENIVFTDSPSGFGGVDGHDSVEVYTDGTRVGVYELEYSKTASPKTWTVQDYNHHMPLLNVIGTFNEAQGLTGKVVDFGPHVLTPVDGAALAKMRAEASVAQNRYYRGASDQCWFRAGAPVKFTGQSNLPSTPLLLVEVEHELVMATAVDQTIHTAGAAPAALEYNNRFRAVDATQNYRPPLVTPKPKVAGVLTATVEPLQPIAGAKDAQIDQNGDYTIRFHFDPAPMYPAPGSRARSSLPVRMMQALAGPDYGIHFPLRGGVEVFILFVEGDPDRPIIAAAAPNPITMSPSTQINAIQSVMRTRSGIAVTFNDNSG
ncbi:MAG TPA: type VI secretion system tip protein TssI/VgrG [Polyangiaceae bacterium]|jgi:type VI secretion system secreted protein VgrG